MRIKVTELHPSCEWVMAGYEKKIINTIFTVKGEIMQAGGMPDGWSFAVFEKREGDAILAIRGFKYIEVPEYSIKYPGGTMNQDGTVIRGHTHNVEPSAMSELGGWLEEHGKTHPYDIGVPKKLSWFQKIRGYDDLFARMESAESMRDHYKTAMTEALRDRDLNAKVADKWRDKLIEVNTTIGRRLTFSVGHNHVTIIVGNPICVAENYNFIKPLKNGLE